MKSLNKHSNERSSRHINGHLDQRNSTLIGAALRSLAVTVLSASAVFAVAAPNPVAAASCPSSARVVQALSATSKLPVPKINPIQSGRSSYALSTDTINLEICASSSVIAHEYGHYVVDLASGGNFEEFKAISARFTTGKNWLKTSNDKPGYERAAHCIGYVLGFAGTYTKCPHASLRSYARDVVRLAQATVQPDA